VKQKDSMDQLLWHSSPVWRKKTKFNQLLYVREDPWQEEMNNIENEDFESAPFEWFCQERSPATLVHRPMINSKVNHLMTCLQTEAENFQLCFSKQHKALLCTVSGNSADFKTNTWHAHIIVKSAFNFMCYRNKESSRCDGFLYRTALNNMVTVSTRSYINMTQSFTSWFT
jgi:hypothetical protein